MKILFQTKIGTFRGCPCVLQRIDDTQINYAEWCVQFAGNGHYFSEYDEAVAYIRKRKFLSNKQIEMIARC